MASLMRKHGRSAEGKGGPAVDATERHRRAMLGRQQHLLTGCTRKACPRCAIARRELRSFRHLLAAKGEKAATP